MTVNHNITGIYTAEKCSNNEYFHKYKYNCIGNECNAH